MLRQREELLLSAQHKLDIFARAHGLRLLHTPNNTISMAVALSDSQAQTGSTSGQGALHDLYMLLLACLQRPAAQVSQAAAQIQLSDGQLMSAGCSGQATEAEAAGGSWTMLGSMLFNRNVSGARVIGQGQEQAVAGICFKNYGAHHDDYPCSYVTVAAAIGTELKDIDAFTSKLEACLTDRQKRSARTAEKTRAQKYPEGSDRCADEHCRDGLCWICSAFLELASTILHSKLMRIVCPLHFTQYACPSSAIYFMSQRSVQQASAS